jgi:hypothetical protein
MDYLQKCKTKYLQHVQLLYKLTKSYRENTDK